MLHHGCGELGADAGIGPALLDRYQPVGLLHGLDDRVDVERPDRAKVDDFGLDPLLRQFLRRLECDPHLARKGGDGHAIAFAEDFRLADRHDVVVVLRHREALAVEDLVL